MRKLKPTPKPGIYPGTSMEEYLSWDAWGASDLREMLKGPEACHHAKYEAEEESGDEQEFGTLAHLALLEPKRWPPKDIAWIEGPYNANPGKAEKRDAEERGFKVQKPDVRVRVEGLVARVREHGRIRKLLDLSGLEREVSAVAVCPITGLKLKARCDLRATSIRTIGDLKTTNLGTDAEAFEHQLWSMGYYTSAPHYCDVFTLADPAHPVDLFLFLVASQTPPYAPALYSVDPLTFAAGSDLGEYLRRRVAACVANPKLWKQTSENVETVGLSAFRLDRIKALLEKEAAAHA